ncbi:MAG: hypothetical protein FJZ97_08210 [Chloroflexi bacterium]|nr:hypothetical protein [Chloroflexota bacterium]
MVRIASYNVENLFARPKAFIPQNWSQGRPVLDAYHKASDLMAKDTYSQADRQEMRDLLIELDVYSCVFRPNPATCSGLIRPVIPELSGHPFRGYPAG